MCLVDINRILLANNMDEFDAYLEALAMLSDDVQRPGIIARFRTARPKHRLPGGVEHGIFDRDVLRSLKQFLVWEKLGSAGGLKGAILERIIDRFLVENLLVRFTDHAWQINKGIKSFWDSGNLPFYVLGLPHVAQVMSRAVVAINVRNDNGDIECGSGVILYSDMQGIGLVVTNRHVVESKNIDSLTVEGRPLERMSDPILSDEADLAKFNIRLTDEVPLVNLAFDALVLDEVVSMGYLRIPTSIAQTVMVHRGEINGTVNTFDKKTYSAISCHVSPGNSGGPIFNKYGYCAGLVTQSGTAKYAAATGSDDGYSIAYHMAVPVNIVKAFVS
jgi:hypothetical protein